MASVFVSDPGRCNQPDEQLLRALYGLSASEAEFTVALISGNGLMAASERMHISLNTAKTHLSHIFSKTGTSKQGELIRLVLTGPAGMVMATQSPFGQ